MTNDQLHFSTICQLLVDTLIDNTVVYFEVFFSLQNSLIIQTFYQTITFQPNIKIKTRKIPLQTLHIQKSIMKFFSFLTTMHESFSGDFRFYMLKMKFILLFNVKHFLCTFWIQLYLGVAY